MVEENPDIGAILLECTDMPPYAHRIQAELNMPVYDAITLIKYAKSVVTQTPYYGFL
jgi:Asp/Glu/hydantoin racemase